MAAFIGILPTGVETGISNGRAPWLDNQNAHVTTPAGFLVSRLIGSGTLTQTPPDYVESNYSGVLGGSYGDIFYNRILLEPSNIDLGNLVASQTRQITVFNGNFSSQTLQSIVVVGDDGLTISGAIPPP